jgi:hypothetical protein
MYSIMFFRLCAMSIILSSSMPTLSTTGASWSKPAARRASCALPSLTSLMSMRFFGASEHKGG